MTRRPATDTETAQAPGLGFVSEPLEHDPMRHASKPPLFRKVNTTARGVRHRFGGEFRHDRHTQQALNSDATHTSMGGTVRRGLDYTPLYRFLVSKIGCNWTDVHSEALSRLDREEPIFQLVARSTDERRDFVCVGGSSFFSGLYIDDHNRLQAVNPRLDASSLYPYCKCCTHTFNGARFTKAYDPDFVGFFPLAAGEG